LTWTEGIKRNERNPNKGSLLYNGYQGVSLNVKQLGHEADHSLPSIAEVKNVWSYTSSPQYAFMAWCSVKAQGQLYLTKQRGLGVVMGLLLL
jgi:hypothetical protein